MRPDRSVIAFAKADEDEGSRDADGPRENGERNAPDANVASIMGSSSTDRG